MGLTDAFQIRFHMAQIGNARLQVVGGFVNVGLQTALACFSLAALDEPQLVLLERAVGLEGVEALRHLGLLFQFVQIGIELAQDVVHTGQVLARVRQTVFGLAAPLFVFGHASGFFQKQTQLFGA